MREQLRVLTYQGGNDFWRSHSRTKQSINEPEFFDIAAPYLKEVRVFYPFICISSSQYRQKTEEQLSSNCGGKPFINRSGDLLLLRFNFN